MINLVLNTIETGHQLCSEGKVAVTARIRCTILNTLGFGVVCYRDSQRCRTVTVRVSQVDRSFVTGDQALVRVGGRVSESTESFGVLHDTTDVVHGHLGEAAVTIAGKEVLTILPERLVTVHTGAVVTEDRFGHESDGLAICESDVLDDVLEPLKSITHAEQGIKAHIDFRLTTGSNFVVNGFDGHADALQHFNHLVTQIDHRVGRGTREVTFLVARLVAEVRELFTARVPDPFDRIYRIERLVGRGRVANVIKDEKLRLRSKVSGVSQAGRLQVGFSFLGNEARIAGVAFLGNRVNNITDQAEGRNLNKRVDLGSRWVGHDQHV